MPLPPAPSDSVVLPSRASERVDICRVREPVIGTTVDVADWDNALDRVHAWALEGNSRYVCFCNVHALVTARSNPKFSFALSQADFVAPDGAPVAWMLRRMGHLRQRRVYGPDFFWAYLKGAERTGEPIYLLGSSLETLTRLTEVVLATFPRLQIAGAYSPPFRPFTEDEDRAMVNAINASGAKTVWVSLGCPKQEIWMAAHHGSVRAVMVGVGAAFDFHAGTVRQAPKWVRDAGLEWFFRLTTEPRRLWRRYLYTNTMFVFLGARQLLERAATRFRSESAGH